MNAKLLRSSLLCLLAAAPLVRLSAQVPASQDTIVIPGDTFHGRVHAGALEATINGDTTGAGERINPNRVYALNEGQYYFQIAPINVYNPAGTLTIAGVPSVYGKTKPVIMILNTGSSHVVINGSGTNQVYGSLRFDDVYYQTMELDGYQNNELFYCGTANHLPQSLSINNCLFEFCNVDLFQCSDEPGAIGGWAYGAKFRFTNSYFRNLFHPSQWWGSRIFQCAHPIDTLWVDNCTITTGGLIFFTGGGSNVHRPLVDLLLVNHCTIINNMKYWQYSPYHRLMFITNNIFMNQGWTGEDTEITNSAQDPDKLFMSTINVDTNNATNGLVVQGKYYEGDSSHFAPSLNLNQVYVYVSDNINYYDPRLISGYYNSSKYKLASLDALPGYALGCPCGFWPIRNIPCAWMNARTQALFAAYGICHGRFVEKRTSESDPQTRTPGIAGASVVDSMAWWNQNQWGDPRFVGGAGLTNTAYIYGDYDPTTLPGIVNGLKTDTDTSDGGGITKFTDLTENFSQTSNISAIDGLPIGSLLWDDAQNAAYNPTNDLNLILAKYISELGSFPCPGTVRTNAQGIPQDYFISQNYPNPFNPSTTIQYGLPHRSHVTIGVFNALGQLIVNLVDGPQDAGDHETRIDGSKLASGVYFCRMQAEGFAQTLKLVLIR